MSDSPAAPAAPGSAQDPTVTAQLLQGNQVIMISQPETDITAAPAMPAIGPAHTLLAPEAAVLDPTANILPPVGSMLGSPVSLNRPGSAGSSHFHFMVANIPEKMKKAFEMFDTDQDGKLSSSEVENASKFFALGKMSEGGWKIPFDAFPEKDQAILKEFDDDGDQLGPRTPA